MPKADQASIQQQREWLRNACLDQAIKAFAGGGNSILSSGATPTSIIDAAKAFEAFVVDPLPAPEKPAVERKPAKPAAKKRAAAKR